MIYLINFVLRLNIKSTKLLGVMQMPNNSLINIAQVLAERVGEKSPTQLSDMLINNGSKKQLNYEIMFQLLMGECEKHILENNGNRVVDEFKNNILQSLVHCSATNPTQGNHIEQPMAVNTAIGL